MSARGWANFTPDTYMRDEEREDSRRMRRCDPIKAEREEAFRVGLSGDWRSAEPGRPNAIRRSFAMFSAVRRERRAFRKVYRNYRRNVVPMADVGHSIVDSWYFLIPLGLMCAGVLVARAWGWM